MTRNLDIYNCIALRQLGRTVFSVSSPVKGQAWTGDSCFLSTAVHRTWAEPCTAPAAPHQPATPVVLPVWSPSASFDRGRESLGKLAGAQAARPAAAGRWGTHFLPAQTFFRAPWLPLQFNKKHRRKDRVTSVCHWHSLKLRRQSGLGWFPSTHLEAPKAIPVATTLSIYPKFCPCPCH